MPGERSPIISTDLERKALEFALSEDGEVESSEDGEVESSEDGEVESSEDGEVESSEDGEVESSEDGEVESHELLGAIKQRGQLSYEAVMSKFEDF